MKSKSDLVQIVSGKQVVNVNEWYSAMYTTFDLQLEKPMGRDLTPAGNFNATLSKLKFGSWFKITKFKK